MYIIMKNINSLEMRQVGDSYSMEVSRIFEEGKPKDQFVIKYHDPKAHICEKCGEDFTEGHACGEPAMMSESTVEEIILKEFNKAEPGRTLIINKGEYEDRDIVVEKK